MAPRYLASTGSTNDDVIRMAEAGAPEWTFLVAGEQTAGKGRLGRSWAARPGTSVLVSVLFRPSLVPAVGPLLALGAAVCAAEACRRATGVEVRCKWPNDLVVGGRKVGGILPEASVSGGRLEWIVVGTGINVGQSRRDFPRELRDTATSLGMERGRPDAASVLTEYLRGLRRAYDPGRAIGPETLEAYRSLCDTIGREVRATDSDGREVTGTATAVQDDGALVIETAEGPVRVAFGEVRHLR